MSGKSLPIDDNRKAVQLVPDVVALAVTVDDTISSATNLTLNGSTTFIEVNAKAGGVYMRYAATASSSNFDEYIQADQVRHYYIPDDVTVVSFIEDDPGAGVRVIEK